MWWNIVQPVLQPANLQFLLYKQLHEPNTYGFQRMLTVNNKVSYEYTDFSYEY